PRRSAGREGGGPVISWVRSAEDRLDLAKGSIVQAQVPGRGIASNVLRVAAPGDGCRDSALLDDPPQGHRGDRRSEPLRHRPKPLHPFKPLLALPGGEQVSICLALVPLS